ncbi:glycosyltransferase family 20-domain-containing protein [Polychytrium aggregatum]|uniref:glycosyltransferase family 20-domain-containing protein n=1 Tax=Polychytrium aggregatum TaxID=110093 RepID=UPI0022FE5754|nr:glycosyltransferase family 20-domain-containing protein [Polychytrium aggregatum]KAI9199212.1 glycosyltransferase family 20-domain-containing protein [Polychytrium aggregatum]
MSPAPQTSRIVVVTHLLPHTCYLSSNESLGPYHRTSSTTQKSGLPADFAHGSPPKSAELNGLLDGSGAPNSSDRKWRYGQRRGHTALFSAIGSLSEDHDVVTIGGTGLCFDEHQEPLRPSDLPADLLDALSEEMLLSKKCIPVFLNDKESQGHYEGYCKTNLWPLFHYLLRDSATDGTKEKDDFKHYESVNQKYADALLKAYQPGDLILVQDYHLLLVPSMIRKALPHAAIVFFFHAPFPSSEIFRCLPRRQEILSGVLGANLVGFQTYSYARHFISSCTRVLGLESTQRGVEFNGAQVHIGVFPIGIDSNRVLARRNTQRVNEKIATIRELYADKIIIFGRDKLDTVSDIHNKLNAFEKFLTLYPEWENKVVLIQVTSPAHKDGHKIEAKISEAVARINGNFGSLEFAPVHHHMQHLDQDDYYALLSVADVGLITSLRDGVNTTSHEFVLCQSEKHSPLILSEFTGTAGSLSSAILVNPYDYTGVASALNDALTMSQDERETKYQQLAEHVNRNTAKYWAQSLVSEAEKIIKLPSQALPTPFLDFDRAIESYRSSTKRLLMFDYDGTLTPIVKLPKDALPPPAMLKAMEVIVSDPKNYCFVISGRDQAFLEEHLGHLKGLGFSAEHGSFVRFPFTKEWKNMTENQDLSWKKQVTEIFDYYTERTQGTFVEHKKSSITWHYRLADPDYGIFQAKECQNHLENSVLRQLPVEILVGKKNLEVRPVSVNKGEIVKKLLSIRDGSEFVICAGDDRTDEDMFTALRQPHLDQSHIYSTTVGPSTKKTMASWHVPDPATLIELMEHFAEESRKDMAPQPDQ